jgi:hypothetical protein
MYHRTFLTQYTSAYEKQGASIYLYIHQVFSKDEVQKISTITMFNAAYKRELHTPETLVIISLGKSREIIQG